MGSTDFSRSATSGHRTFCCTSSKAVFTNPDRQKTVGKIRPPHAKLQVTIGTSSRRRCKGYVGTMPIMRDISPTFWAGLGFRLCSDSGLGLAPLPNARSKRFAQPDIAVSFIFFSGGTLPLSLTDLVDLWPVFLDSVCADSWDGDKLGSLRGAPLRNGPQRLVAEDSERRHTSPTRFYQTPGTQRLRSEERRVGKE